MQQRTNTTKRSGERWPVERSDAERTADALNVFRDLTATRNYGVSKRHQGCE